MTAPTIRPNPFTTAGTSVNAGDAFEAMRQGNLLGWNVRKMDMVIPQPPILTDDGVTTVDPIPVKGRYATVRTNPRTGSTEYLGDVGSAYQVLQNETHIDLIDSIIGEAGAVPLDVFGGPDKGGRMWMTLKLPTQIDLGTFGGVRDVTDMYLVARNDHGGNGSFRLDITPIRAWCSNMLDVVMANLDTSMLWRHTSSAVDRISAVHQTMDRVDAYGAAFATSMERLLETPMPIDEAWQFFDQFTGAGATDLSERSRANRVARRDGLVANLTQTITLDDAMRGTRYGVFQAATEWLDHLAPVRGQGNDAQLRATRAVDGSTQRIKQSLYSQLVPA